jgi:hypothetical protein
MFKAIILIFGVAGYLVATQLGNQAATAGLADVEKLYTRAATEAAVISAANR